MTISIGFIGFGEVGTTFGRDFRAAGVANVAAHDTLVPSPAHGPAMRDLAATHGIRIADDLAGLIDGTSVVFSAVTASSAEAVAQAAATHLRPGQLFVDVNSASPATKRRAAAVVTSTGADYVEAAVMAPVAEPRLAVPILAGGPAAGRAAELLNPLGMAIRPVSEEFGRASAMKLCRSIMIKGIEALIIDCAAAAQEWGVEDEVFGSLNKSFPGTDWAKLAVTMKARVQRHGIRRAAEMREAADMLADLGRDGALSRAVADRHEANAGTRGAERAR